MADKKVTVLSFGEYIAWFSCFPEEGVEIITNSGTRYKVIQVRMYSIVLEAK